MIELLRRIPIVAEAFEAANCELAPRVRLHETMRYTSSSVARVWALRSDSMTHALQWWTRLFAGWVLLFSIAAYVLPTPFSALAPFIVPGLGLIMFGMGMTLLAEDFARVARKPRAVAVGLLAQFVIMPLLAIALARLFRLSPELTTGFVILGACPGGTASNVISYLAKADVALSVTMTACSTVAGVVLTPLLTDWLAGSYLPVDAWGLFASMVKIVIIPVVLGLVTRRFLGARVQTVLAVFPAISVLVICLVIAAIVALARDQIPQVLGIVGVVTLLHNVLGLALGYGLAAVCRLPHNTRRTIAIEVGMQNSGLAVALAKAHFASVLTALPGSLFSVVHNLTGSALASWWGSTPARN